MSVRHPTIHSTGNSGIPGTGIPGTVYLMRQHAKANRYTVPGFRGEAGGGWWYVVGCPFGGGLSCLFLVGD